MPSRSLTLLGLVAALAVGFVAGRIVGSGGPAGSGGDLGHRAAARENDSGAPGGAGLEPPSSRPSRNEPRPPTADEVIARVSRSAADSGTADAPAGDGFLRGRVLDERDRPVAGATVVAIHRPGRAPGEVWYADRGPVGRGWNDGEPRDSVLEAYVRDRIETDARLRTAETDGAGAFAIDGLREGAYQVRAYLDGHDGDAVIALTGAEVTLELLRVGVFELDPRLPDGTRPERAAVVVEGRGRSADVHRWSADDPVLRLGRRAARITVHSADIQEVTYGEFMSSCTSLPRLVDLDEDGNGPHRFDLLPRTGLAVRLRPTGLIDGSQWFEVEVNALGSDARVALERNDDLHYATADAPPGPCIVRVRAGGGEDLAEVPCDLEQGLNEVEVTLDGADESEALCIVCVDGHGDPVEIESIGAAVQLVNGSRGTNVRPLIRPGGEHWVEWRRFHPEVSEIERVTLTLVHAPHGRLERTVEAGTRRVEVVFQRPCELTVQVRNLPGDIQAAAFATIVDESEAAGQRGITISSPLRGDVPPDGTVLIGGVQPGTYDVAVETYWGNRNENTVVERRVEITGKAMTVDLTVPALHDVEVVVAAPAGTVRAELLADDGSEHPYFQMAESDDTGVVTFEGVPAGRYRVTANEGAGNRVMLLTVPCGWVDFAPSDITGYVVRNVRTGSIAEEVGFREGDVLVGSADVRIDGKNALARALAVGLERPVELIVERSGREVRLTLPRSESGAPYTDSNFGLWLEARLR